jgi:1-acyl-sn-glycerol-3-phosphate acyltransferase
MAADKWRCALPGLLLASTRAIFIKRGKIHRQALRDAMAVLERGGVLGIAPEGTHSKTGAMQEGRAGAAYIACRAGVAFAARRDYRHREGSE